MSRLARLIPIFCLALAASTPALCAGDPAADPAYASVEIASTKTSIYIGSVTMTFSRFIRDHGCYVGVYRARVFPFVFYNESGRLTIEFSDDQLRRLARGETVTFTGLGVNTSGGRRRVAGKATSTGPQSGRLSVDVYVTRSIKLAFHTSYRLAAAP